MGLLQMGTNGDFQPFFHGKDLVHHPIDSQPFFILGCFSFQEGLMIFLRTLMMICARV